MRNVVRITKPGGYVLLAVPYIFGLMPQLLRTHWYGHGSGQHLNFFSKESMVILLEKHGFEIEDMVIESMDYAPLCLPDVARKAMTIHTACARCVRHGRVTCLSRHGRNPMRSRWL